MVLSFQGYPPTKPVDYSKMYTSSDEIAKKHLDQIAGKTILVTGVSPGGIGAALCLSLSLGSPKLLILAGRNLSKVNQTIEDCKAVNPNVPLRALELDLSSLEQVSAAANSLTDLPSIDILINNAGIMAPPFSLSPSGYELQFATNHLGHFYLTRLLLPLLLASPTRGTVINLTSQGHRVSGIIWDDVEFSGGATYDKWRAYGQSKTANILHALALKSRVGRAFSVNPGAVGSNLTKEDTLEDINGLLEESGMTWETVLTPKQGASTVLMAALDPDVKDETVYLECCQESGPAVHASSPEDAERLWKMSEEMINANLL